MNYRIAKGQSPDELVKEVKEAIAKSWEPIGGVACVMATPNKPVFYQAMIKKSANA